MRLLPLLQVEEVLIKRLTQAGTTEQEATRLAHIHDAPDEEYKERELTVNSHFVWKGMFSRIVGQRRNSVEDPVIDWDDPDVGVQCPCPLSEARGR